MEIIEQTKGDVDILTIKGRLDAVSKNLIKENINSLVKNNRSSIVLDMGFVDFIDSSGLGSLVSCLRLVNKLGGDIKISSLQEQVRGIFELTRLHRVFQIFDDTDTAADSFC